MELRERLVAALGQRYEVGEELGSGGMAHVFAAHDRQLGRPVAIKVLNPELASSVGAERFQREINVTANLRHPHILKLFDSPTTAEGLLYYIMDFVEGESLAGRIAREKQLSLDDAMTIVRQAADALDYAHRHGVVHRDIKPANILLEDGNVLVADFGLARLVEDSDDTRLTQPALVLGTPAYMSPEQFGGEETITGRSDVYSLACVFHEMLAGDPPFTAKTREALRAKHLQAEPPRICAERPNCPSWFDAVMRRALAKVPADRFATAGEFVRALESGEMTGTRPVPLPRTARATRRRRLRVAGVALALVAALVATLTVWRGDAPATPLADPNAFVVVPFSGGAGAPDSAVVTERVAAALAEWDGVVVVDSRRVRDALAERAGRTVRLRDAVGVARDLGAGRLVWGETSRSGDSVDVRAIVYEPATERQLRSASVSYPVATLPSERDFRVLVNQLLRIGSEGPWQGDGAGERPSLPAWSAYDSGRVAAARWQLVAADSFFARALRADGDHALAQLWLGRVRIWNGRPRDEWRGVARRAVELRARLDPADALAADAQLALGDGRFPEACERYAEIVSREPASFPGWFGLGECRLRDSAVVVDKRSPTGYSFRASWQRALDAYLHIVREMPAPHPEFVYARFPRVLFAEANVLRKGRAVGDPRAVFYAYASLAADTLGFVPVPATRLGRGSGAVPGSLLEAIEHNRGLLRQLYAAWVRDAPRSLDARVALATLLETLGEPAAALEQIRAARSLARDSLRGRRLARTEVRLLVKRGEWTSAARLADSLLRVVPLDAEDASTSLAGPAALTGRVGLLTRLFERDAPGFDPAMPNGDELELPGPLRGDVARLRAYAVIGACVDSIRDVPARVERRLESYYPHPQRRSTIRDALLRRPLSLAAPCLGVAPLLRVESGGDRLVSLQQALARSDTADARAQLERLKVARLGGRPGDVAIDYTYLEAWVLAQLGDTAQAIQHLDRSLEALPTLGTWLLDNPAQSAGLVRAMALRARLAAARHDDVAASRWAVAVASLRENADPELSSELRDLRDLAGRAQ